MSDDQTGERVHVRRRLTWVDRMNGIGAAVAIAATITGAMSYAFDALPFAKASEVAAIRSEVATVKQVLSSVQVSQKETQELQLMDRVQQLEDRLTRLSPDSGDYSDFRLQRTAAQQRLLQVRDELSLLRR